MFTMQIRYLDAWKRKKHPRMLRMTGKGSELSAILFFFQGFARKKPHVMCFLGALKTIIFSFFF